MVVAARVVTSPRDGRAARNEDQELGSANATPGNLAQRLQDLGQVAASRLLLDIENTPDEEISEAGSG